VPALVISENFSQSQTVLLSEFFSKPLPRQIR